MVTTITSKGQITLPMAIRQRWRLRPGDKVDFVVRKDGKVEVSPLRGSIRSLKGCAPRPARPVTLARMEKAIRDGKAA